MSDSDSSEGEMGGMFVEPAEYNPPPPEPTFEVFTRSSKDKQPQEIKLRLVGSHPLWGHHLWNAAKVFANWMDIHPEHSLGKNVLELGAGAALPSFVAAVNGASKVKNNTHYCPLNYHLVRHVPVPGKGAFVWLIESRAICICQWL